MYFILLAFLFDEFTISRKSPTIVIGMVVFARLAVKPHA